MAKKIERISFFAICITFCWPFVKCVSWKELLQIQRVLNYVWMPWFWLNHFEIEFSNVVQSCRCWNHILAFILFVDCVKCKRIHTWIIIVLRIHTCLNQIKRRQTCQIDQSHGQSCAFVNMHTTMIWYQISLALWVCILRCKMAECEFEINMFCWRSAIVGMHTQTLRRVHHLFAPSERRLNERLNERSNERLDKTKLVCRFSRC